MNKQKSFCLDERDGIVKRKYLGHFEPTSTGFLAISHYFQAFQ